MKGRSTIEEGGSATDVSLDSLSAIFSRMPNLFLPDTQPVDLHSQAAFKWFSDLLEQERQAILQVTDALFSRQLKWMFQKAHGLKTLHQERAAFFMAEDSERGLRCIVLPDGVEWGEQQFDQLVQGVRVGNSDGHPDTVYFGRDQLTPCGIESFLTQLAKASQQQNAVSFTWIKDQILQLESTKSGRELKQHARMLRKDGWAVVLTQPAAVALRCLELIQNAYQLQQKTGDSQRSSKRNGVATKDKAAATGLPPDLQPGSGLDRWWSNLSLDEKSRLVGTRQEVLDKVLRAAGELEESQSHAPSTSRGSASNGNSATNGDGGCGPAVVACQAKPSVGRASHLAAFFNPKAKLLFGSNTTTSSSSNPCFSPSPRYCSKSAREELSTQVSHIMEKLSSAGNATKLDEDAGASRSEEGSPYASASCTNNGIYHLAEEVLLCPLDRSKH